MSKKKIEGWINLKPRSCLPPFGIVVGQLAPWILWIACNNLVFEDKIFTLEDALLKAILVVTYLTHSSGHASILGFTW